MKQFKQLIEAIRHPNKIQSIILGITTVILVVLASCTAFIEEMQDALGVFQYVIYALGAISITQLVYMIFYWVKKYKEANPERKIVIKNDKLKKVLTNYELRSQAFLGIALILSIGFAVYNIVLSVLNSDKWNGVMGLYYLLLTALYAFTAYRIYAKNENQKEDVITYLMVGAGTFLLPVALIWGEVEILMGNFNVYYSEIFIYALALYTFVKLGMAIGNLKRTSGMNTYTLKGFRVICFIDALVSMLTLQLTMYKVFGKDMQPSFVAHGLFCSIICLGCIAFGVIIIIRSVKLLREMRLNIIIEELHNHTNNDWY